MIILKRLSITWGAILAVGCSSAPKSDWQELALESIAERDLASTTKVKAESLFNSRVLQKKFKPQKSILEKKLLRCGQLVFTDSPYNQRDVEEAKYVMRVDCNNNYTLDSGDGEHYAVFESILPQQKGWFNRYSKLAREQNKTLKVKNPVPFICVDAEASEDPCAVNELSVVVKNPTFTSDVAGFVKKYTKEMNP